MNKSNKSKSLAVILCVLLGVLGVHRFYVGKTKSGILYLCTFGLFGIGWIYDIFNIVNNLFTDSYGAVITDENPNQNNINKAPKKPAHLMWQFWVAVVVFYVFTLSVPSNSKNNSSKKPSENIVDTTISIKTDSTDISVTEEKEDFLIILDTNRKEYHLDVNCDYIYFPDDENRTDFTVTADNKKAAILYVESLGYKSCYKCVDKYAIDEYEDYIEKLKSDTDVSTDTETDTNTNTNTNKGTDSVVETETDTEVESVTSTKEKTVNDNNVTSQNSNIDTSNESKPVSKTESKAESKVESTAPPQAQEYVFYANMKSMCYHTTNCHAAQEISAENRFTYTVTAYSLYDAKQVAIQYFESQGYRLCEICGK